MFWMPIEAYKQSGITSRNIDYGAMNPRTVKNTVVEALKTQPPSLILIDASPFPI